MKGACAAPLPARACNAWGRGVGSCMGAIPPAPQNIPSASPVAARGRVYSPMSYPELASWLSFQGLKRAANSHCLLIYVYFFFSLCAPPGAAPVAGTVPHQLLLGFTAAHLLVGEKVLPESTLPHHGLSPPELLGLMRFDAARICIPVPNFPDLVALPL